MASTYSIILNSIVSSYLPPKICKVNLSFGQYKYGIVGRNGVGKTTLLKLMLGDIKPNSGSIRRIGSVSDVPQLHGFFINQDATIADVLGISDILKSIANVRNGSCNEHDFEVIGDHWDIEARAQYALAHFNLDNIGLHVLFGNVSDGQKTKILLSKTLIFQTDFILFDEPTNNLDKDSRNVLYRYIENSKKGIIVVSHDRALLNNMNSIVEITTNGINIYGGNFEYYKAQQKINNQVLQRDYNNAKMLVYKTQLNIQNNREKQAQRRSEGKNTRKKKGQSKMILDGMKSRSEKSQSKMFIKEERLVNNAQSILSSIQEKIEMSKNFHVMFHDIYIPKNKVVLSIEDLCFHYKAQKKIIHNFNLRIVGPERVAINGPNGAGKSTLFKLMLGKLKPNKGRIALGVEHVAYLDQSMSFLDSRLSIIDNFLKRNPELKIFDAYSALSYFDFCDQEVHKEVGQLSGGERMRAGLAIALMLVNPPQLLVLDEPTNHLDFETVEAIERALAMYKGAILAISHDDIFLENIGINHVCSVNGDYFPN